MVYKISINRSSGFRGMKIATLPSFNFKEEEEEEEFFVM